jgi:hypothetical protein
MDAMLDQHFSDDQYAKVSLSTMLRNAAKYGGGKWILRSPGNDLLDYYDQQNTLLGLDNRAYSAVPPSVVFDIRFRQHFVSSVDIRKHCKNYKKTKDPTYWFQVQQKRYNWLIDKPSEIFEFEYKKDVKNFLQKKFDQKQFYFPNEQVTDWNKMFWRGKCAGWSIVKEKNAN